LAVAALSAGSLSAAGPSIQVCTCPSQADWNFPAEASQLLKEVRAASHPLTVSAEKLRSLRYAGSSWQGHASELSLLRENVNDIGEKIQRLQAIRHVIEPWQQEAVDSVTKAGVTLASSTEAAIRHLNDNRTFLWSDTYRSHLASLGQGADQMKQSVSLHLEMSSTQEKLEELRQQVAELSS
jgi:hypothetical protein